MASLINEVHMTQQAMLIREARGLEVTSGGGVP